MGAIIVFCLLLSAVVIAVCSENLKDEGEKRDAPQFRPSSARRLETYPIEGNVEQLKPEETSLFQHQTFAGNDESNKRLFDIPDLGLLGDVDVGNEGFDVLGPKNNVQPPWGVGNEGNQDNPDFLGGLDGFTLYKSSVATNVEGPHGQIETIMTDSFHKEVAPFDVSEFSQHHGGGENHGEVHYHEHKHVHNHEHKQQHAHQHHQSHKHQHGHHHEAHHKHDHGHKHEQHHKHAHDHKHKHGHDHKHHHGHEHGHKHQHKEGHKHHQEHKHDHKHKHSHGHKHHQDHKHDHHHHHKHGHHAKHGHHHGHKHEHSNKHDHKHEHKQHHHH